MQIIVFSLYRFKFQKTYKIQDKFNNLLNICPVTTIQRSIHSKLQSKCPIYFNECKHCIIFISFVIVENDEISYDCPIFSLELLIWFNFPFYSTSPIHIHFAVQFQLQFDTLFRVSIFSKLNKLILFFACQKTISMVWFEWNTKKNSTSVKYANFNWITLQTQMMCSAHIKLYHYSMTRHRTFRVCMYRIHNNAYGCDASFQFYFILFFIFFSFSWYFSIFFTKEFIERERENDMMIY